jgi:hypothetical protein
MNRAWELILDFMAVWLQPILGFVVLVSGALMSFSYVSLREQFPKWPGLFDILEGALFFWVFLGSAALTFVFSLLLTRREKTILQLKSDLQRQSEEKGEIGNNIIILFDGLLLNLSRRLDIPQGIDFRISLYVHDAENRRFIPCGRYTPNPTLSGPGRTSYPDHEGCIAEGWKRGWHFDGNVPGSGAQRRNYNRQTYSVPDSTNANIRMASQLYAVKRLDDASARPVAVLVVEAIEAMQFNHDAIRSKLDEVADDFARMVNNLKGYIPNPASAAESGL